MNLCVHVILVTRNSRITKKALLELLRRGRRQNGNLPFQKYLLDIVLIYCLSLRPRSIVVKASINKIENFTQAEKAKFLKAMDLGEIVWNSERFRLAVIDYQFTYTFVPALEIYHQFMSGADKLNKEKDQDLDIFIKMYYSFGKAIGYTKPNTVMTWINRKFFKYMSPQSILGNVTHEYMHKLGYDHPYRSTPDRNDSVPYAYGYIATKLANEFISKGVLK
jgi:hypothetical protein